MGKNNEKMGKNNERKRPLWEWIATYIFAILFIFIIAFLVYRIMAPNIVKIPTQSEINAFCNDMGVNDTNGFKQTYDDKVYILCGKLYNGKLHDQSLNISNWGGTL